MSEDWGTVGHSGPASKGQEADPLQKKAPAERTKSAENGEAGASAKASETDLVVISGPARQVAKLREQIDREPEIRSEKVLEIKARVQRGGYHVPAREILKKMVEQAISESRRNRGHR